MAQRLIGVAFFLFLSLLAACGSKSSHSLNKIGGELTLAPANTFSTQSPATASTTVSSRSPSTSPTATTTAAASASPASSSDSLKETLIQRYDTLKPLQWGENVPGVRTRLQTKDKVIALTFDACGGPEGSGYDQKLIDFLIHDKIPATLFINARWIDANPDVFQALAHNPLFEIENHGSEHRPLSVSGRSAYNIRGTRNVGEVIDEIQRNEDKIEKLTGRRSQFFRSGTAYYDDVAVRIAGDLGLSVVNYSILGDAGATYNTQQVYEALIKSKSGSIVIAHMNHPEKDTAEGVIKAVPMLTKAGFTFTKLSDYPLE